MPILVSFLYLLFSITIGWNAIHVHLNQVKEKVKDQVQSIMNQKIQARSSDESISIDSIEREEKTKILTSKSFS